MLAAAGTGLSVATGGCIREVRSAVNRDGIDQLSLTIATVPADADRESVQLARAIRSALEAAGMAVSIDFHSEEEFLRSILINHDFDVYVARHPGDVDPGYLYAALHSRFVDEAGWQNPFGFSSPAVDERLEALRRADADEREAAVDGVLEAFAVELPFVPICTPEEYRLARTDRFAGWEGEDLATRRGYLGLEPLDGAEVVRAVHVDARPSENLNPLSVEYRDRGTITDLLYDSLATVTPDGDVQPWLADSWTIDGDTVTVDLREDLTFHDGEALTAADVAFTYRLLADTTLGERTYPAPTPRFRGRVATVEAVAVVDDGRLEFAVDAGEPAAARALAVPILPEHVWRERASQASVPGVRLAEGTTEALVTNGLPPIGSGPYRFENRAERDSITLERFDDHFTLRPDVDAPAPAPSMRIRIAPRSTSAIEQVGDDADVTTLPLESYVVDDVLAGTPEDVAVLATDSPTFYHLGFNARVAPFGNPNVRRAVARLIDKAWLVETIFDGYAKPIAAPVTDEWTPAGFAWDGSDPVTPFLGSDGELDRAAVRATFEEAGFGYGEDGTLRVRR